MSFYDFRRVVSAVMTLAEHILVTLELGGELVLSASKNEAHFDNLLLL